MRFISAATSALMVSVVLLFTGPSFAGPAAGDDAPGPAPTPVATESTSPAAKATCGISRRGRPYRSSLASRRGRLVNRIAALALRMQGVPYVFGGTSAYGVDCSGFTMRVFGMAGVRLRRMADEQYYQGRKVATPESGDLVFFSTYLPGPSHVGISLGGRRFIHASSSSGVRVDSLDESYYRSRYIGARRFF